MEGDSQYIPWTASAMPTRKASGLRIANPDGSSSIPPPPATLVRTQAPTATNAGPEAESRRLSVFDPVEHAGKRTTPNPAHQSPESKPLTKHSTSNNKNPIVVDFPSSGADSINHATAVKPYQKSMPLNHHKQQQHTFFPQYQSSPMQIGNRGYASASSRPVSGVYSTQPPVNGALERPSGSYRLRSESSNSSASGLPSRSDSRNAGTAMQAGTEILDNNHRDRSYSQSHPMPSGTGPLPPRRSSKGMAGGHIAVLSSQMISGNGNAYSLDGPIMPSSEEWKDKGAAVGVRQEIDASGKPVFRSVKKGVRDFSFGRTLGEGSYSTVLAATDRQTLKEYAVKVLDKRHIIREKKIKYVGIEKDTLNRLTDHPGIVRLYYTFQDERSLYYVLDIASGGELLGVLKKIGTFDEECTRFYGAQILDAISYMHSRGVIHRDLKPENVLLDDQMHVKITDFGTAKLLKDPLAAPNLGNGDGESSSRGIPDIESKEEDSRATSFVGTAEYVSPELLTDKNACKASDLWAFGCIIYQLLSGRPPFKAANEYQTFQKIVTLDYEFPSGFPLAARDLVERLLVLDPSRRLSLEHIKNHEFFDGIKWGRALWRTKAPRLKPYVPPTKEATLIQLNGFSSNSQPIASSRINRQSSTFANGSTRPQPRVITELPPPTQLDIEWSPVLTRNNERILRLGNLMILSSPVVNSTNSKSNEHGDGHKKLSRFFGGSTTKKRQRLVMVTSSGRIILAAAGGDEKKSKTEISLLSPDCAWHIHPDSKGQTVWSVDTRGMHYTFEDIKSSKDSAESSRTTPQEWIESIERAKDLAISQSMLSSYSSDTGFGEIPSSVSSPASTIGGNNVSQERFNVADRSGRKNLSKNQTFLQIQEDSTKKHRFSKRQSKNGLAAVF